MARPAIVMPANTRSGNSVRMTRSLKVPGSPSSALQITYFSSPFSEPAKFHFIPVGKPAPPRPFMPDADTVSMMSGRDMASAALRPASPSMEAKVRVFPWVSMLIRGTPPGARPRGRSRRRGTRPLSGARSRA